MSFSKTGFSLLFLALLWPAALHAQLSTGTVNFDVDSLRDQTQVTINLSDSSTLILIRDYVVDHEPDSYTWVGYVQSDVNGSAVVTVNKPNAVGTIQTSTKLFELTITQALGSPVQEIDPLSLPSEAEPLQGPVFRDGFEEGGEQLSAESPAVACDDTPASIDVMVLYSDDANLAAVDIEAEIRQAITVANDSFLRTHILPAAPDGIELKLNLVHTQMVEVDENSGADIEKQVTDFKNAGDGYLDLVHGLRDQFKADLNFLILESASKGGIAYVSNRQELAFAVVRRKNFVDHTFTHEMGHLFGAKHDKYALQKDKIPPPDLPGSNYGYSHLGLITGWRTIMAYNAECEDTYLTFWCPRLGFFSSPDYTHDGNPTGVEGTDNRKQLIDSAAVRACYRERPTLSIQKLNKANGSPTTGGLVESSGNSVTPAIVCGNICEGSAAVSSSVMLTAKDSGEWRFVRWAEGGVCPGSTNPQCNVTVDGNKLAKAEFTDEPLPEPTSFQGEIVLTGPAAITGSGCTGTLTLTGTATVNLENSPTLTINGSESINLSCYSGTGPVSATVQLNVVGNSITGQFIGPFTCPAPCVSGQSTYNVDLQRSGSGSNQILQGTIDYTNENQTPFLATTTGAVTLNAQ